MRFLSILFSIFTLFVLFSCENEELTITPSNEEVAVLSFPSYESFSKAVIEGLDSEMTNLKFNPLATLAQVEYEELLQRQASDLSNQPSKFFSIGSSGEILPKYPFLSYAKLLNLNGDVIIGNDIIRFQSDAVISSNAYSYSEFTSALSGNYIKDKKVYISELNLSHDETGLNKQNRIFTMNYYSVGNNHIRPVLQATSYCVSGSSVRVNIDLWVAKVVTTGTYTSFNVTTGFIEVDSKVVSIEAAGGPSTVSTTSQVYTSPNFINFYGYSVFTLVDGAFPLGGGYDCSYVDDFEVCLGRTIITGDFPDGSTLTYDINPGYDCSSTSVFVYGLF